MLILLFFLLQNLNLQSIDLAPGPQLPNPESGHVNLSVENPSGPGQLIATSSDGQLYVLMHPIIFRASVRKWHAGQWGFVPDGYAGSEPLTQIESYIRLPIDFGGLMKHFRLAVTENTLNGPIMIQVRHNGGPIVDTLTNQPVQIIVPAGQVGGQTFACCRNGQINININPGDQLYFLIQDNATSGTFSGYWTLAL